VNLIISQASTKILVVDDDADNGLLPRDFLQISGFDVDVYFSSEEAAENFQWAVHSCDIKCSHERYRRNGAIQYNVRIDTDI
jgi:CheY-like chemotaxis protein